MTPDNYKIIPDDKISDEARKRIMENLDKEVVERIRKIRTFDSGATRDDDHDKLKYEGFISPHVLHRYAKYMHRHRLQSDGSLREPDNWQKGIPAKSYMDSLVRHTIDLWRESRTFGLFNREHVEELLCAIMFNAMGMLHEFLKPLQLETTYATESADLRDRPQENTGPVERTDEVGPPVDVR